MKKRLADFESRTEKTGKTELIQQAWNVVAICLRRRQERRNRRGADQVLAKRALKPSWEQNKAAASRERGGPSSGQ